ncbi:hypothetical protein TSOC_009851 [Tetrabaena socialis]|uniref:Isoprenylcysteine carboxylmethyltransferase family protein n=1 Tax=Tetrabaena socialis TaxID=47790 RepID=A0A2J7ZUV0_9CHLO|nr:hypothetical protein TSOC_009851 [Tetrabaena socialis]|eukprot:PNH04042.1 hypothetical protein TSOC_009851 [Tetrabaena socialis]
MAPRAQVAQLAVVLSLLLLLPAGVHDGGLTLTRPFTTLAAYFAFFGLGSVARMVRHGPLAPRAADRQVASWRDRLAFAAFVVVLPLLHWYGMYRYAALVLYTDTILPYSTTLFDLIGGAGMVLAILLNWAASRELGGAYDRVVAPAALITTGPYRFVQHPIYTSYALLFVSYGLWLHSGLAAVAALAVCALYYSRRTALEAEVLQAAFGSQYRDYASRTKRFVPLVL